MQRLAEEQFVVLNDEPVTGNRDDLLGTADMVSGLADLITASRQSTPFTLAIDAGWGMGKSSLMRQLQHRLDDVNGIHTVWFNAWTSGTDALEVLIKSVLLRFDRNVIRRAYNRVTQNSRITTILRIALGTALGALGMRRLIDDLWSRLSVDAKSRNEIRTAMQEMARDWARTSSGPGQQLVIFVDDLDRCSGEVVLTVCEAIKLYLDVPGLVFVIGCDQSALSRHLQQSDATSVRASEYLEKVVQVNYHAPSPSQDQIHRLVQGYALRSGTHRLFGEQLGSFVGERTGRNPRRIKRLINSFVLEYHLDRNWQEFGAETLVRVLLLQHFYSDFYRLLVSPSAQDPVQEFLDYRNLRSSIRLGESDSEHWQHVFTAHGIKPPGRESDSTTLLGLLEQLEQEVPEPLPSLVTDEEFTSVVRQLKEYPDFERLRRHLQRRSFRSQVEGTAGYEQRPLGADADLSGLRILVVDDVFAEPQFEFTDPAGMVNTLREWGAVVDTASDYTSLERTLLRAEPDMVVSDINRHGNDNAGLEDLQKLRDQQLYSGPVVFYVARVTSVRRKWADKLGAVGVTNSFSEALEWIRMAV
ncbi:KAP-like P-loop domain-containing protein [Halopolyspora algeriensis]|uniref:KAP-like P-loop domain-containing protein n=1 Tax=Halopolyspora algeriensis TaxID=1500506 RepID=A0A368VV81_9ACTN|nr:P-loop NTPase fold protein [Halopolyspora algeriensis]RCW44568.1 KAP-like P-loop domain-containing protein [Halopolyspora algeriensis]TQM55928.1 KAP-like P-loop domain-containing protein [Halopolyspora algeriensis]